MEARLLPLDAETKVAERPDDHKDELRLWLRLFACKEVIEGEVRRRLRDSFNVTLRASISWRSSTAPRKE